MHVCLFVCVSVCSRVCLSVSLFVCLYVCLPVTFLAILFILCYKTIAISFVQYSLDFYKHDWNIYIIDVWEIRKHKLYDSDLWRGMVCSVRMVRLVRMVS